MATQTTTKNWLTTNLGEICSFLYGKSLPEKNRIAGSFPVYGSNGVVGSHNEALVKLPGIIIGRKGSIGLVHFSKSPFCPIDTTFYITQDESNVDLRYLYYFLKSIGLNKLKADVGVPGINREMVYRETVSVPNNIKEQKAIARVLMTVQEAIDGQEAFISKLKELKRSMMQHLFTHGTTDEKSKMTEIGELPESWDVVKLGEVGDVSYGIQAAVAALLKPVGFKILTNKNITLQGAIVLDKVNYYQPKTKRELSSFVEKGDILLNWRSGSKEHVGKTAIYSSDEKMLHSSFILRIRTNQERVINKFLFYYLNWLRETGYFVKLQTYSVNAKFNKSAVLMMEIAVPPNNQQVKILEALDSISDKIELTGVKLAAYQNIFKILLHELMSGERRVKVIYDKQN